MSTKTKQFLISAFMVALTVVALLFALNADAAEAKKEGVTVTLTQEEADQCAKGGGCILMSQEAAAALVEYMEALEQAAKSSCRRI